MIRRARVAITQASTARLPLTVWRLFAIVMVAVAVVFAIRDTVGYSDTNPITALPYGFHDRLWGVARILMLSVAATVAWWGSERSQGRIMAAALIGLALNNNWWFYSLDNPLLWPSVALNYLG